MELCVQFGPLVGRPYGGVATLVCNELLTDCELINAAERFIIVSERHTSYQCVFALPRL